MKTVLLIASITLGILFPFTHKCSFLIRYLLMLMLFFSFIRMDIKREHFHKSHLTILIINILLPILLFIILRETSIELAIVVFITGIAPTAIASPIIINLLGKKIEFVVISILITNFSIAFILPFLLPHFMIGYSSLSILDILFPVTIVFLIPFVLSETIKRYLPKILSKLREMNNYVFYILVININLGTSKASNYINQEMSFADPIIFKIGLFSFLLCLFNFYIGKIITPSEYKVEGGQSLGQKNNGFTIWVALTFISPLAVLGPVFYILFQNLYISFQLHRSHIINIK